jgi:Flp pilus assembly protein TadG
MRTLVNKLRNRGKDERGAALIEFALVMPLLLILVLGMIEFGWLLGNNLDVRHGAREAARLAAVDAGSVVAMGDLVCASMDFSSGQTVTFVDSAGGLIGDEVTVTVTLPYTPITGFINAFLPATLDTSVRTRLEQPSASWTNGVRVCS